MSDDSGSDEDDAPKARMRKRGGEHDDDEPDWHEDDMPPMPTQEFLCELMKEPERNATGDLVLTPDEFRIKYGYSWDYCVVLKRDPDVPLTDAGELDEENLTARQKKSGVNLCSSLNLRVRRFHRHPGALLAVVVLTYRKCQPRHSRRNE